MRPPSPDDPDALASYVDAAAALLGLRLDAEMRTGVIQHLALHARAMALLDAFALPDAVEPGPVWEP